MIRIDYFWRKGARDCRGLVTRHRVRHIHCKETPRRCFATRACRECRRCRRSCRCVCRRAQNVSVTGAFSVIYRPLPAGFISGHSVDLNAQHICRRAVGEDDAGRAKTRGQKVCDCFGRNDNDRIIFIVSNHRIIPMVVVIVTDQNEIGLWQPGIRPRVGIVINGNPIPRHHERRMCDGMDHKIAAAGWNMVARHRAGRSLAGAIKSSRQKRSERIGVRERAGANRQKRIPIAQVR